MSPLRATVFTFLILFAAHTTGCVDEQSPAPDEHADVDADFNIAQSDDDQECEDGESRDGDTGECITDDQGDAQNENGTANDDSNGHTDPEDCDDGETWNPVIEACVDDCDDDEIWNPVIEACVDDPDDDDCPVGDIESWVCNADGEPTTEAEITLEGSACGEAFERETDPDDQGHFEFVDVPAGTHSFTIEVGNFISEQPLTVEAGETTVYPPPANCS